MTPGKHEYQGISTLQLAQAPRGAGVVGQRVIGEDATGNNVGTHGATASRANH